MKSHAAPPVLELDSAATVLQPWGDSGNVEGYMWAGQEHCLAAEVCSGVSPGVAESNQSS